MGKYRYMVPKPAGVNAGTFRDSGDWECLSSGGSNWRVQESIFML